MSCKSAEKPQYSEGTQLRQSNVSWQECCAYFAPHATILPDLHNNKRGYTVRARSDFDSDISSSTGLICCAFRRSSTHPPVLSRRDTTKEYLREYCHLGENYIRAEIAYLNDAECYLLRRFYGEGLRGAHIRRLKKHDLFDVMLNDFLDLDGAINLNFENYLKQMMYVLPADQKEQAFCLLLGVCKQSPDKVMERIQKGVLNYHRSFIDLFLLFEGMSEVKAAALPDASYIKPSLHRVPTMSNIASLEPDSNLERMSYFI